MTATATLEQLRAARDHGAAYLSAQQNADGSIGEPAHGMRTLYKPIWAFASTGQTDRAWRLVDWIVANALTDDGDLAGPFQRGRALEAVDVYANAWVAAGAARAGRPDLAIPMVQFMRTLQDEETGGFFARRNRHGRNDRQELLSTAQAGNALLMTGDLDSAMRVGLWLERLAAGQPEPQRALYYASTPSGGVTTEFPTDRAAGYVVRVDQPAQPYFLLGIGPAFLSRLARATGETRWLETARKLLQPALAATDAMYETAQVGKVGWGAALLAGVTGEDRYAALAWRVAEALLRQKMPDGHWDDAGGWRDQATANDVTAEIVVLLDEMWAGLATTGRSSGG